MTTFEKLSQSDLGPNIRPVSFISLIDSVWYSHRPFIVSFSRLLVSSLGFPRQLFFSSRATSRACIAWSHEDGIFSVFPSIIQVRALAPDFPCKSTQVCAPRLAMQTPRCSRYSVAIHGETEREREREKERGRETTVLLIASPVTPATYTRQIFYSSRFARALVSPPSNKRERAVERGP